MEGRTVDGDSQEQSPLVEGLDVLLRVTHTVGACLLGPARKSRAYIPGTEPTWHLYRPPRTSHPTYQDCRQQSSLEAVKLVGKGYQHGASDIPLRAFYQRDEVKYIVQGISGIPTATRRCESGERRWGA